MTRITDREWAIDLQRTVGGKKDLSKISADLCEEELAVDLVYWNGWACAATIPLTPKQCRRLAD